jgi:hypothetical protein
LSADELLGMQTANAFMLYYLDKKALTVRSYIAAMKARKVSRKKTLVKSPN